MKEIKYRLQLFLLGFPYGIMGKIIKVEDHGVGKYTVWDRVRHRLLNLLYDGELGEGLGKRR